MRHLVLGALLFSLAACMGNAPPPIPLNPVRFLLINDVYVADTMLDGRGGLARVATVRKRLADQGPVLFVLAGDVLSPSLLSKYYGGGQMVDALNAAKLDYATFGNHEFDLELDTLEARIAGSRFKWISSNCTLANGSPLPKVLPWDTLHVSGHKVGLFAVTLPGNYPAVYRCSDPDSAAQRVVEALSSEGADLIVGLTHQPVEADRNLLAREPRIDLILGGHEHQALDSTVSGRHVAKADANARSAQFATLWGGKGKWRQALGLVPIDAGLPPDSAVSQVVAAWEDSLEHRLGPERTVATTGVSIDPGLSLSRRGESMLGGLVTDAIRVGTGTDVALLNSGTLRLDNMIRPGPITNRQLESISGRLKELAAQDMPIVVAGDFNDWRHRATAILERRLGMTEVSVAHHGRPLATFPSMMPLLRLDRIYVRGFQVTASKVHRGKPWSMLSDHLAVSAELERA